jgi:hypothetical protein
MGRKLRHSLINSRYRCNTTQKTKRPVNPQVPGSSPGRGAKIQEPHSDVGLLFCFAILAVLRKSSIFSKGL